MSNRLFSRFRVVEPVTETAAGGVKSPREALNEQWLRIRAGLGGSSTIDSMEAVYQAELRELRSAETQACAIVDEIWVTLLNGPLADRVSEYVATLRRRAAEHEGSSSHRNPVMRALVHEASRIAENCTTNVRDVVLVATLQHIVHYLITSYGTVAAHAKTLGLMDQAERFRAYAESDRQLDLDLSSLAKTEVNARAPGQRDGTAS